MSDFRYGLHPANPRRTIREEVAPAPIAIGSVVRLKSGGPGMTVCSIVDGGPRDGMMEVVWLNAALEAASGCIHRDCFEVVR
jgi:uncharacterized protein YodC (DUF2158 family)